MKRALVTGGSGDIGGPIAKRLAADGLHVVVHSHQNADRAIEVVEAIRREGGAASAASFDLAVAEECERALEALLSDGPIQVLVNNAGIHDDAPFAGMRADQWHRVLDVSLDGFFYVTRALLMPMMRSRWGRIINIGSMAGVMGNRGQVNYAAAKAGLQGATKSLALEVASRGITVNLVAPGIIQGAMSDGAFDSDTIRRLVPMQRAGKPEEVAALVGFLASDEAAYISGQIISINGAMA
jgi:3-oxoacyl-[acyl-carrier protein] reductase